MTVGVRIQARRDTAANWTSANPVLAAGEAGLEADTGKVKYGDGTTAWTALPYFGSGAYAALSTAPTGPRGVPVAAAAVYVYRDTTTNATDPDIHLYDAAGVEL